MLVFEDCTMVYIACKHISPPQTIIEIYRYFFKMRLGLLHNQKTVTTFQ